MCTRAHTHATYLKTGCPQTKPPATHRPAQVSWLRTTQTDLVVSDVVPIACAAAAQAGIPAVAVTNFSWGARRPFSRGGRAWRTVARPRPRQPRPSEPTPPHACQHTHKHNTPAPIAPQTSHTPSHPSKHNVTPAHAHKPGQISSTPSTSPRSAAPSSASWYGRSPLTTPAPRCCCACQAMCPCPRSRCGAAGWWHRCLSRRAYVGSKAPAARESASRVTRIARVA